MKKIIAIAAAITAAIVAAAAIWLAYNLAREAAYADGFADGVTHAIEDSEVFTVTCYDPDHPEESACGEYDQLIFIELDDCIYRKGMYQG